MTKQECNIKEVINDLLFLKGKLYNGIYKDKVYCIDAAVHTLKKASNSKIRPIFLRNSSDTVSVWECKCGNIFKTFHKEGVLDDTDINYCSKCGCEYDWSD